MRQVLIKDQLFSRVKKKGDLGHVRLRIFWNKSKN